MRPLAAAALYVVLFLLSGIGASLAFACDVVCDAIDWLEELMAKVHP